MNILKLKTDIWDASVVYDATIGKTQAQINEEITDNPYAN